MRKIFCSPRIFAIFVKTHFLIQHSISKVFEKSIRLTSKLFAWWEKIFACCKNMHPWFCSQEKPHYGLWNSWTRLVGAENYKVIKERNDNTWRCSKGRIFKSFKVKKALDIFGSQKSWQQKMTMMWWLRAKPFKVGLADLLSGLSFAWERICGNVKPINPFFYPTSLPFLEGLLNLNMFVVIGTAAYQNRHAVSQLYGNRVRARRWGFWKMRPLLYFLCSPFRIEFTLLFFISIVRWCMY